MSELWKDIDGFPQYQVSNFGRVRRIQKHRPPRILTANIVRGNYHVIRLQKNKTQYSHMAHRLVYEAFVSKIPDGFEIHHKDFNPQNNHVSNLEAVSPAVNNKYTRDANRVPYLRGLNHPQVKYSKTQILITKKMLAEGFRLSEVSRATGVGYHTVYAVREGKQWANMA